MNNSNKAKSRLVGLTIRFQSELILHSKIQS